MRAAAVFHHIKIVNWMLAAILLATGLAVTAAQAHATEITQQVTGTVQTAQGAPVADTTVYVTAPDNSVALYTPVTTAVDGTYTLTVAQKTTYDIHFEPLLVSNVQGKIESDFYVHSSSAALDAYLLSASYHTLSGTVSDDAGVPLEGVTVNLSTIAGGDQTATTDNNGVFTMLLTSDTYAVSLALDSTAGTTAYPNVTLAQGDVDMSAGDVNVDYNLPEAGVVTVTAHDRSGTLATNQPVVFSHDGQTYETTTDAAGIAAIPFLRANGITEGTICVTFSQTDAVVCNTDAHDGTADIAMDLYEPVEMTLTGVITDSTGSPVPDIHVILTSQIDSTEYHATSDANGAYMVSAAPAEYDLTVTTAESMYATKKHWSVFTLEQGTVDLADDQIHNVALPALRTLHIDVTGHSSTSLRVDADPTDSYTQSALNNPGSADFITYDGQILPIGSVCATYEASNAGTVCNTEPLVADGDNINHSFVAPEMYKFSGQILNADSSPAKGKSARLLLNGATTALALGKTATFSISLTPGTYTVHALATGGIDEDMGTIDIVDTNVTQSYQFSL
jgi:hypothetical protein